MLLAISAVVAVGDAFIAADQNHTAFDFKGTVIMTFARVVVGVAMYYGLYKPTGLAEATANVLVKDSAPAITRG